MIVVFYFVGVVFYILFLLLALNSLSSGTVPLLSLLMFLDSATVKIIYVVAAFQFALK